MTRFQSICRTTQARATATPLNTAVQAMLARGLSLDEATTYFQRVYVLRAGTLVDGHGLKTSELLGVSRNTLTRLLRRVGLSLAQPHRATEKRTA